MRAADLDAAIALGALPFCANERTYPILLAPDRIERIEAGELDVEFGVGIPVEQFERLSGTVVPFAVDIAKIAADAFQMSLKQSRNVRLIDRRRRQRHLRTGRPRHQGGDLPGILLGGFVGSDSRLLDLALRVRDRLPLGLCDFLPRSLGLLLRKLRPPPGLLEFLPGLFEELLLCRGGLARIRFIELAQLVGLLGRLFFGVAARVIGAGVGLLCGQQFVVLGASQICIEAGRISCQE